ncbi:GNAT family N-acetyltransferase [Halovulum dunhuangense]|uniref:GNAT family N-acetyltransferase n=1 Tax=Halovulum dunhuangense TaxID=1505036 RepID=A0A849KTQ1_9RHOB|nr:GNAT family N-acetyltransferase [Halovulum dunhuangense]NNU78901.1 GNAT family N-acetyltransferase [Halovulum dunhuangense]
MTPEALAALHARAFPGPPRPWSAAEFAEVLALPGVALFTAGTAAFLIARRAGPEAEILTLCTAPDARRQGHAARLLAEMQRWAEASGVEELFLEVAETNIAARALYAAAGFVPRGHRKDYYDAGGRVRVHAHVMGKCLAPKG